MLREVLKHAAMASPAATSAATPEALLAVLYAEFQRTEPRVVPEVSVMKLLTQAQDSGTLPHIFAAAHGMSVEALTGGGSDGSDGSDGETSDAGDSGGITGGGSAKKRPKTAKAVSRRRRRGRGRGGRGRGGGKAHRGGVKGGVVVFDDSDEDSDDSSSGSDAETTAAAKTVAAAAATMSRLDRDTRERMLDTVRGLTAANRLLALLHEGYDMKLKPRDDGARRSKSDWGEPGNLAFNDSLTPARLRDDLNYGLDAAVVLLRKAYPRTLGRLPADVIAHAVRSALNLKLLNAQRRRQMQAFRFARVSLLSQDPFLALCNTELDKDVGWRAFHVPGAGALDALLKMSDIIIQAAGALPPTFTTRVVWNPDSLKAIHAAILDAQSDLPPAKAAEATLTIVWRALQTKAFDALDIERAGAGLTGASGLGVLSQRAASSPGAGGNGTNAIAELWNDLCVASNYGDRAAPGGREGLLTDLEAGVAQTLRKDGLLLAAELVEKSKVLRRLELVESETSPQLFYDWVAAEAAFPGPYPQLPKPRKKDFRDADERDYTHALNIKDAYDLFTSHRRYARLMLQFGCNLAQDIAVARSLENRTSSLLLSMASSLLDTMVDAARLQKSVPDAAVDLARELRSACEGSHTCKFPAGIPIVKAFAADADAIAGTLQRLLQGTMTGGEADAGLPQYNVQASDIDAGAE